MDLDHSSLIKCTFDVNDIDVKSFDLKKRMKFIIDSIMYYKCNNFIHHNISELFHKVIHHVDENGENLLKYADWCFDNIHEFYDVSDFYSYFDESVVDEKVIFNDKNMTMTNDTSIIEMNVDDDEVMKELPKGAFANIDFWKSYDQDVTEIFENIRELENDFLNIIDDFKKFNFDFE